MVYPNHIHNNSAILKVQIRTDPPCLSRRLIKLYNIFGLYSNNLMIKAVRNPSGEQFKKDYFW